METVERANLASKLGGNIFAKKFKDFAVIITWHNPSHLKKNGSNLKKIDTIQCIGSKVGMASVGITSDASFVANSLVEDNLDNGHVYGKEIAASRFAKRLARACHDRTLSRSYRPLGIRSCFVGYSETAEECEIFEVDCFGNLYSCESCCIGPQAESLLMFNFPNCNNIEDIFQTCKDVVKAISNKQGSADKVPISIGLVGKNYDFTVYME